MNPEQALQFLQSVCDQTPLAKQGHVNVQAAVTTIRQALTEAAKCAAERKAEQKKDPEPPTGPQGV